MPITVLTFPIFCLLISKWDPMSKLTVTEKVKCSGHRIPRTINMQVMQVMKATEVMNNMEKEI